MIYADSAPTYERNSGRTLRMVEALVEYCKTHCDSTVVLIGHNEDFIKWYLFPMLLDTLQKHHLTSRIVTNRNRVLTITNDAIHCLSASSLSESSGALRGISVDALFEDHFVQEFLTTKQYAYYRCAAYPQLRKGEKPKMILSPEEQNQLNNWFSYHPVKDGQLERYQAIREAGKQMALTIVTNVPNNADRTAALRKIREAVMTANAAIACGE